MRPAPVPRGAATRTKLNGLLPAAALLFSLSACLGPDPEATASLRFRNPELAAGLDSLDIFGINAIRRDTLLIRHWTKGEDPPAQADYPPGLEKSFTLLVLGYLKDVLVYQSHSVISNGKAQDPVKDFRLAAPALPDAPLAISKRVQDSLVLQPAWETRPGVYLKPDSGAPEVYTPEASFTWTHAGQVVGRDEQLALGRLALADSGTYVFTAENRAGIDSMVFVLAMKQMLPKIKDIGPQKELAGKALTVKPVITHSDALLYRWARAGTVVSTDSVLAFPSLKAADTGTYTLAVANVSDTTEVAVSNAFTVGLTPPAVEAWKAEVGVEVGAQANTSHGTVLDLDAGKVLYYSEAAGKENVIELLFVYSGGGLKLMNGVAARKASDLNYADKFDSTKLQNVQFVKTSGKPSTPDAGRTAYAAGSKLASASVAAGDHFLVKTTDNNLVWLQVKSIQNVNGTPSSSSSASLVTALAPFTRPASP